MQRAQSGVKAIESLSILVSGAETGYQFTKVICSEF